MKLAQKRLEQMVTGEGARQVQVDLAESRLRACVMYLAAAPSNRSHDCIER